MEYLHLCLTLLVPGRPLWQLSTVRGSEFKASSIAFAVRWILAGCLLIFDDVERVLVSVAIGKYLRALGSSGECPGCLELFSLVQCLT